MREPTKQKDSKQPKKKKDKVILTELPDKTVLDPKEATIEDVSNVQPSKSQPSASLPSKENLNYPPQNNFKTDLPQNNTQNEGKVAENLAEKEKYAAHNAKIQIEKPFNLQT